MDDMRDAKAQIIQVDRATLRIVSVDSENRQRRARVPDRRPTAAVVA
jgi:hypothetical protein